MGAASTASPAQSAEAQSSGSGAMPRGAAYWPPSERVPAKKKMSSLHIRNAPRFSPGCSADPQALPWPRSQSPRTAP